MAFVPKDVKWYVAQIVEEIRIEGDPRNVVHTNEVLIHAKSPEAAYKSALAIGKRGNTRYKNPHGKTVTIRFRGLKDLAAIYEELQHGAEINFKRDVAVSEKTIKRWILPKEKLEVFSPIRPHAGPDYASAEVLERVYERWPHLKGVRGPGSPRRTKKS